MNNMRSPKAYTSDILPQGHTERVENMRNELDASQNRLSVVGQWIDKYTDALTHFDSKLQAQIIACDKTQIFHEQCQQALDHGNIEQMIEVRDKLAQQRLSPAV